MHHRTIQINHQPDATIFQFIILTFIYSSTCFGRFHAHHQELNDCIGSLWFYLPIVVTVVLCSWSGRDGPARPRKKHDHLHDTKVKPDVATAVIDLLMMGGKTPETRWAVNKRQDNKLKNCCIWLVNYVKNPIIRIFCTSEWFAIPINPEFYSILCCVALRKFEHFPTEAPLSVRWCCCMRRTITEQKNRSSYKFHNGRFYKKQSNYLNFG